MEPLSEFKTHFPTVTVWSVESQALIWETHVPSRGLPEIYHVEYKKTICKRIENSEKKTPKIKGGMKDAWSLVIWEVWMGTWEPQWDTTTADC